jgi:ABC-type Fe3+ transport system permease subunit
MEVQVNYLAVLVAMFSSLVVGSIWYAQAVFGKRWAKLARIDMSSDRGSVVKPIVTTVVVSLITAYVLAHVTYLSNQFFGYSFLQDALTTAFWMWLGFTAARFVTHDAFEGRPVLLTVLNVSHELVTFMVMGLIIGLFGI